MPRPPLSQRSDPEKLEKYEVLREGVPPGLVPSLVSFIALKLFHKTSLSPPVVDSARFNRLERVMDRVFPRQADDFMKMLQTAPILTLDIVDHLLGESSGDLAEANLEANKIAGYLHEARSAWTVGFDEEGQYQLERRQSEELSELIGVAVSEGGRAGEHLRLAWAKAFGRDQDSGGACIEAVKAIEVAGKSVVSPNNPRTTLGTMIADMRAKPGKWTTDSKADEDIERVISMMQMVWQGHYRHGDESEPIDVSPEGAIMAVHIAVVLVQWFRTGYVRRA